MVSQPVPDNIAAVFMTLFLAASFIVAAIVNSISRARRARYNAEVQAKLIERLGTARDLLAFASTEAFRNLGCRICVDDGRGGTGGTVVAAGATVRRFSRGCG